jgi:hypothetical protein
MSIGAVALQDDMSWGKRLWFMVYGLWVIVILLYKNNIYTPNVAHFISFQ